MVAMDVIPNLPVSPRLQTPPNSPQLQQHTPKLSSDHGKLLVDLLNALQSIQNAPPTAGTIQPADTVEDEEKKIPRARASKVEYKTCMYPAKYDS